MANAQGRLWRLHPGVNATRRGRQDLTEWNLFPSHILGLQLIQICANKPSEERCSHIVRVAFWDDMISSRMHRIDGHGQVCGCDASRAGPRAG